MAASKNVNVDGLIEEAQKTLELKDQVRDKLAGLRGLLRFAVSAGEASPEQSAWIEEAFNRKAD